MDGKMLVVDGDGYLVDERGERAVFYPCDPKKNFLCDKAMCRGSRGEEDEGGLGFCACTKEKAFQRDRTRPFYKRLNKDGYFGREYVGEDKP